MSHGNRREGAERTHPTRDRWYWQRREQASSAIITLEKTSTEFKRKIREEPKRVPELACEAMGGYAHRTASGKAQNERSREPADPLPSSRSQSTKVETTRKRIPHSAMTDKVR